MIPSGLRLLRTAPRQRHTNVWLLVGVTFRWVIPLEHAPPIDPLRWVYCYITIIYHRTDTEMTKANGCICEYVNMCLGHVCVCVCIMLLSKVFENSNICLTFYFYGISTPLNFSELFLLFIFVDDFQLFCGDFRVLHICLIANNCCSVCSNG